jgi:hypothetical protein
MERLHNFWNYIVTHPADIGWAAFFGLVFALILDVLDREGRIRTGHRLLKNKIAERSVAKLQERIKQLQIFRDTLATYLTSDKALYLSTFRVIIIMLVVITIGAAVSALGGTFQIRGAGLFAVFVYALAVAIGIQGIKLSSLDTHDKILKMIAERNDEIADLEKKLEAMVK